MANMAPNTAQAAPPQAEGGAQNGTNTNALVIVTLLFFMWGLITSLNDVLIPHLGLTTKGNIGAATAVTLEEGARRVQAMHDAARRVRKDILVLCHGGPLAEPADAQYILDHTEGVVGFYGASSMERLPVEPAIRDRVQEFTRLRFKR